MRFKSEDKFPIVVTENGLHIMVDDILTPMEAMQLIRDLQDGLFAYKLLTGKNVDERRHGNANN